VGVSEHERALRAGGLAILPTDTVYGIGCAADDHEACARLYACKSRGRDQPMAVVLGTVLNLLEHVLPELTGRADVLCRRVLPGPVTLVVPNPARRFAHLCGATPGRIGVRVPVLAPEIAALADAVGGLALTSANLRGEAPPDRLANVPAELSDLCAFTVDGGILAGAPSSVIDVTGSEPVLLRAGADTDAAMTALLG
jgi:L-threonylcarbamoyladenylate synthase